MIIQALDNLESTHCIQVDINGLTKAEINGMKGSIKHAGIRLGHKGKIRFAMKAGVLYVWSNK